MKIKAFAIALSLGLGLVLALMWLLGGVSAPASAAPDPDLLPNPAERAPSDATPHHYVATGGTCVCQSKKYPFDNSFITHNIADTWDGGGLYLYNSHITFTNTVIADNRAHARGSGLYVGSSDLHLSHTTLARNRGGDSSGLHLDETPGYRSTLALTNTILVSHTLGITVAAGNTATLESTLWGAGAWANGADWGGAGTIVTGAVNVWGEPDFVDPATGDYHIGPDSAARDAGINAGVTTDIDGEPRPYLAPDLGTDEYWPPGALRYVYLPIVVRAGP